MKKEYAVNIELVNSDSEWNTADRADWYESYSEAYDAAEKAFEDPGCYGSTCKCLGRWRD